VTSASVARISPAFCPGYAAHAYRRYKRKQFDIGLIKDQTGSFVGGLYFVAGLLAFSALLTLVPSRSLQRPAPVTASPHS
jgi:hypothetical protein